MPLTWNPITWITVPPPFVWHITPWWFHAGFVLTFAWMAFELIRDYRNLLRYRRPVLDLRDPHIAISLVFVFVFDIWMRVIASAFWMIAAPVKLYRHEKNHRDMYKAVNSILGYN